MTLFKNSKADLVQRDDLICVGTAAMWFCSRKETLDSTANTIRQNEDFRISWFRSKAGVVPRVSGKLLREQGNSY